MRSNSATIREPRQARGHETRERILAAAEVLLRTRTLEEITIEDIVVEARSSVGSFYHLFGSKETIIAPLYERYDARITRESERVLRSARRGHRSLDERARLLVHFAVRAYRRERGLIRAMVRHARGPAGAVTREQQAHRATFYERLAGVLLECRDEMSHPDPGMAVRMGLFFVGAACRDKILFGDAPHPRSVRVGDRALADELSNALLAYLHTAPGESKP